jgi:glycosyltransferase involved in cell wall biosynthesis
MVFLVPPKDPETLAEKIIKLLNDDELRTKMGKEARRYAEENFDWKKIIRKWYQVYESVI